MKALELADAYADSVAAHRLESLYGTSKSYTLEKAKARDEAREALAAELRRLAAVEADCAQYLKEGETPAERIKRAIGDADSLLNLYRDVMAERDALKAERDELRATEAAWRKLNDTLLHQVICCGVAASHPDATLATRGAYAGRWNSKQAEAVRELRADRDSLRAELERIKANPVHQFRKSRCADWFDGLPDHTDGGGPYETRTLYALGSKT